MPGNVHRDLSEAQFDWPQEVVTNPTCDPLLLGVALLLAIWDACRVLGPYLGSLIDYVRRLREVLVAKFGDRWFDALRLAHLWGNAAV